MTTCERLEQDFLEHGLSAELLAHAEGCARCSASVETARTLDGLRLAAPSTPQEARAIEAWTRRALERSRPARRRPLRGWVLLAASLVLGLVGYDQVFRKPSQALPPPPPRVANEVPRVARPEAQAPPEVRFEENVPSCVVDDVTASSVCVTGVAVLARGRLTLDDGVATIETQRGIDVDLQGRRVTVERGWVELRVARGGFASVIADGNTVVRAEGLEVQRLSRAATIPGEPAVRRAPSPRVAVPSPSTKQPLPVAAAPDAADVVTMTLRRARDARRRGDVVEALAAYEDVLRRATDPQTRQFALVAIGELSLQAGRAEAACEAFARARGEPGSLTREAWLGQIGCLRLLDPARAQALSEAFRSAFPDDPATSTTPAAPR